MSDHDREKDDEPTTEELQEPSTEKDPGEEPEADTPHDPEPSHEAIGIGVVDGPDPERVG